MGTNLLEIGTFLQMKSVQAMANQFSLKAPVSVITLIQTFVQWAVPYDPIPVEPSGDNVKSPVTLKWVDPGADWGRRATKFRVELHTVIGATQLLDVITTSNSLLYNNSVLEDDTKYRLNVLSINKYGTSSWVFLEFQTAPAPPAGGGPGVRYLSLNEDASFSGAGGNSNWMYYHVDAVGAGVIQKVRNGTNYHIQLTHGTTVDMPAQSDTSSFNGAQIGGHWSAELIGVDGPNAPSSMELEITTS
jgi:hypothetical protein